MYVTPETFARHLDWLQERFRGAAAAPRSSRAWPAGAPAARSAPARITFDDGWRDNHEYALPAARAPRSAGDGLLVTERVGTPGAFWPDEVCRRLAPLGASRARAALAGASAPLEAAIRARR